MCTALAVHDCLKIWRQVGGLVDTDGTDTAGVLARFSCLRLRAHGFHFEPARLALGAAPGAPPIPLPPFFPCPRSLAVAHCALAALMQAAAAAHMPFTHVCRCANLCTRFSTSKRASAWTTLGRSTTSTTIWLPVRLVLQRTRRTERSLLACAIALCIWRAGRGMLGRHASRLGVFLCHLRLPRARIPSCPRPRAPAGRHAQSASLCMCCLPRRGMRDGGPSRARTPRQAEAGNDVRVHDDAGGGLPRTGHSRCSRPPALSVP